MARTVTVQEIVDEVQILVEDPSHALATEAEYVRRINRTNARLYAMYLAAEPDRYRTEATITAGTGGTSSYNLPADWYATIGVDRVSGNTRTELRRLHEEERNDYAGQTGTSEAFRLLGSTITLYPTPTTGQTYTHIYLPTAPVIASVADTLDLRVGHEDGLEKMVARTLLQAKREYDGRWDDEIEMFKADLRRQANQRYYDDVVTMMRHRNRRVWPYGPGLDYLNLPRLPRP